MTAEETAELSRDDVSEYWSWRREVWTTGYVVCGLAYGFLERELRLAASVGALACACLVLRQVWKQRQTMSSRRFACFLAFAAGLVGSALYAMHLARP